MHRSASVREPGVNPYGRLLGDREQIEVARLAGNPLGDFWAIASRSKWPVLQAIHWCDSGTAGRGGGQGRSREAPGHRREAGPAGRPVLSPSVCPNREAGHALRQRHRPPSALAVREAIATVPVLIEEVAVAEIGDARAADLPETSERRRVGVCQQGRRAACEGEETLDVTKGFRESGRPGSNRRRPAWEGVSARR
jgi:hypothetical protein